MTHYRLVQRDFRLSTSFFIEQRFCFFWFALNDFSGVRYFDSLECAEDFFYKLLETPRRCVIRESNTEKKQ